MVVIKNCVINVIIVIHLPDFRAEIGGQKEAVRPFTHSYDVFHLEVGEIKRKG